MSMPITFALKVGVAGAGFVAPSLADFEVVGELLSAFGADEDVFVDEEGEDESFDPPQAVVSRERASRACRIRASYTTFGGNTLQPSAISRQLRNLKLIAEG